MYCIIMQMKDRSQEQNLIKEIQMIVYPTYPLGCSSQDFLAQYQQLFDALRRFDRSTDLAILHQFPVYQVKSIEGQSKSKAEQEITDHIIMSIIELLNASCSHCHRLEYSQRIFSLLGEFKGNLKDLAIGKTPIRISYWVKLLEIQNPAGLYYGIKQKHVLAFYDNLYQQLHYIPHREIFLLNYTNVLLAQQKFESALRSTQNCLPVQHQLYLAIIASATYGCKYLWCRSVGAFLRAGGDPSWIEQGSAATPPILQEMSKYSTMVAYNFKQLYEEELFKCCNSSENYLIYLIWLCYYQALACIDLTCGFIPEDIEYSRYLPNLPTVHPSLGSFEAIKRTEGIESVHELRAAEEFASLYSWDSGNEKAIEFTIEGTRSINSSHSLDDKRKMRIQSAPVLRQNPIYLLGRAEQEDIFEKISNSQSLRYLRSVFEKYVHFGPLEYNYAHRIPSPFLEDNLILASEWDFELKGLNRIELVLGSKVRQGLQSLVSALRVENNEKSKQLKHYYEFFNNYMYQYESYTKLMKQLSINEKNYLKLITKSPFLFTEQTFLRMKTDLAKLGFDSLDFMMEAVSYKLELSINLLSFLFDRATEECP